MSSAARGKSSDFSFIGRIKSNLGEK